MKFFSGKESHHTDLAKRLRMNDSNEQPDNGDQMWPSESKGHKILPDPNQDVNNESAADVQNIVDIGNKILMFVSIKVYPGLRDHIQVTKDIQEVCFRVIDNAGTGNCFYEAILATNVFRRKFPKYKDDHNMLRAELQKHAVCNPGLAREFYQLYATPPEKIEEAIHFLNENLEHKGLDNGKWFFEKISKDETYKIFREHIDVEDDSPNSV
jgi:hypothetical protein